MAPPTDHSCLDVDEAAEIAAGTVSAERAEAVEDHLDRCPRCRRMVSELLRRPAAPSPVPDLPNALPQIGRYVVLSRIGSGAMGIVYAAYDPTLDRKVALKLLRADLHGDPDAAEARGRLVREAQAMARLSHPNVIPVHEVGVHGDQPYVSMELVDGATLGQWATEAARGWEAILEAYQQAGRGLAAAHAAGLVHRDFKPDNVLRSVDGRVLVTDFGLARAAAGATASEPPPIARQSGLTEATLTRTGILVGTPAFMAPELLAGAPATAASDQYSFSVALYQALHGAHPFPAATYDELQRKVLSGQPPEVPRRSRVPLRVRQVLARGLARDPGDRFPSVDAMLAALDRVVRRRRRLLWATAGAGIAAGAAAAFLLSSAPPVCPPAEARLRGIWDAERKAAVKAAFERTGAPFAGSAWREVETTLDAYGRGWVASHTDSCEATWVRREQSDELLDLRMACLGERLGELGALVQVLSEADAGAVERAAAAVSSLAPPSSCDADLASLRARVPADPALRRRVAAIRADVDRAAAMRKAGRFDPAYAVAQPAAAAATRLGFRPLEADALLLQGQIEIDRGHSAEAEATLERAALAGEAGRNDEAAATAWVSLVSIAGYDQARVEDGRRLERRAAAAVERLAGHERIEAWLDHVRARIALRAGEYAAAEAAAARAAATYRRVGDALAASRVESTLGTILARLGRRDDADAHHRAAVEGTEAILGPVHPELAKRLINRAALAHESGRYDDAIAGYQRAVDIFEKTLGPNHPDLAVPLSGVAGAMAAQGRVEEGLAMTRRALAARESVADAEPIEYAQMLQNIGSQLAQLGRVDEALDHLRRALAIKEKALGPRHDSVASTVRNIAICLGQLGDDAGARPLLLRNLSILEGAFGDRHPRVANAHVELGLLAMRAGDARSALASGERARDIVVAVLGDDDAELVEPLTLIGRARTALGAPAAAIAPLERAIALYEREEAPAEFLAEPRFALAAARWQLGRDRPAARAMAAAAAGDFARRTDLEFNAAARTDLAAMRAWLARPGRPARPIAARRAARP